jgi:hypothetical protein
LLEKCCYVVKIDINAVSGDPKHEIILQKAGFLIFWIM